MLLHGGFGAIGGASLGRASIAEDPQAGQPPTRAIHRDRRSSSACCGGPPGAFDGIVDERIVASSAGVGLEIDVTYTLPLVADPLSDMSSLPQIAHAVHQLYANAAPRSENPVRVDVALSFTNGQGPRVKALTVHQVWPIGDALFDADMLGDDLEAWLAESALMKRTFRNNALISGLIERRMPKHEKTGRQITFSTDLIYDVLRSHEPDHILLQAARQDAGEGLLDIRRLADALKRIKGKIVHSKLDQISPFAVPVMLEIGKEPVFSGDAAEAILREAEDDLVRDAMS